MTKTKTPIVVDLDGTLILSDLLIESFLVLIKQNPFSIFSVLLWLLKGKAYMKQEIATRAELSIDTLPFNEALVQFLIQKKAEGYPIALATASHRKYADLIADHLKLFDNVFATENGVNLSGARKKQRLNEAYGVKGYHYAGNAEVDLEVWQDSAAAIVVGNESLTVKARRLTQIEAVFPHENRTVKTWIKALRVHQWVKNGLIFVPLLASHQFGDTSAVFACLIAFLSFSLCASSVYLLNDLLDLKDDRLHQTKRNRPFAAGTLDLLHGLLAAPGLLVVALLLAGAVSLDFAIVLVCYYILTFAYSFYLKRVVLIDVVTLASLYTVRIVAGAAAIAVPLTFWLLAFSIFVFLSLAIVKRYTELLALKEKSVKKTLGRGYQVEDVELLSSLGGSSGYISVLVLALYINSSEVKALYDQPMLMWPICLVMLYWISRVWIIAHRGEMNDDPIVFALKDRVSMACGLIIVGFMLAAAI